LCAGCAAPKPAPPDGETTAVPQKSAAKPGTIKVVALGDSLTAGLGLSPDEAYPSVLQQRLNAEGLAYDVVNAGVSGDTSAGGLARYAGAWHATVGRRMQRNYRLRNSFPPDRRADERFVQAFMLAVA
jgi:hypothetical protein